MSDDKYKVQSSPPLVVNRVRGTVKVWNRQLNDYYEMSNELIEDLVSIIKDPDERAGVLYKKGEVENRPEETVLQCPDCAAKLSTDGTYLKFRKHCS